MVVGRRWLVNGPVVHWRVLNWVGGLNEVEAVNAINDDVTLTKVLVASHAGLVGRRGLIDGPVVHGRVFNWVLSLGLELNEVEADSVNDEVSHAEVLVAVETVLVRRRRLVD
jgi:hypothetical protein